ncbi:MAG: hypothetical protein ACHQRM_09980 [Bacteroidia bacterium]
MATARIFCIVSMLFLSGIPGPYTASAQSTVQNNYVQKLDTKDLEGTWYIVQSTAKAWTGKGITHVMCNFQCQSGFLKADYTYELQGKSHELHAIDKTSGPSAMKESRDKGVFTIRHTWYVVAMGDNRQWIVLYYGRKLLGRESISVLCKSPVPTNSDSTGINKVLTENYFLQAKSKKIKAIPAH